MIALTRTSPASGVPFQSRTTSRSETMPSTAVPSELTTTAPMLRSASRASSSVTVAWGEMVTTS